MQRDPSAPFSERLLNALRPPPKTLDRFDMLAIDLIAEAQSKPFREARASIADKLRLLDAETRGDVLGRAAETIKAVVG